MLRPWAASPKGRAGMCEARRRVQPRTGGPRSPRRWWTIVLSVAAVHCAATGLLVAARLPLRAYTTVDGLPNEHVNAILPGRSGDLWIATDAGLSRFDGQIFRNYDESDGLPTTAVLSLLEMRSGVYWVGTARGLCRFDRGSGHGSEAVLSASAFEKGAPTQRSLFDCAAPGPTRGAAFVMALGEDASGSLWVGTADGLYRLEGGRPSEALRVELPVHRPGAASLQVTSFAEDGSGGLWIGTDAGLVHRLPDGGMRRHPIVAAGGMTAIRALLRDHTGRIWAGTDRAAYVFRPRREAGARDEPADVPPRAGEGTDVRIPHEDGEGRFLTSADGLSEERVSALIEDRDGHIWLGTEGLVAFDGHRLTTFTTANGLTDKTVLALAEDAWGNIWLAPEAGGLQRLHPDGFTSYGVEDGLGGDVIVQIFDTRHGDLGVLTGPAEYLLLNRLEGTRFASAKPNLPPEVHAQSWGWNQMVVEDREGDWWFPTGEGLVRFPPVDRLEALRRARPKAWYRLGDGLPAEEIFRLFEDSHGDIWIGTVSPGRPTLGRWDRAEGAFHVYALAESLGAFAAEAPTAFREDSSGNLWIGFGRGGLVRHRDGRFEGFPPGEVLPEGRIGDIYLDRSGRLWVATSAGGVARCDAPDAEAPRFRRYTKDDGLASNGVACITEDRWGRIYLGTTKGINRLDPNTEAVRRFGTEDGLAREIAYASHRDAHGNLWFGTHRGLSHLRPRPDLEQPPLTIRITELSVAGVQAPLPHLGASEIRGLRIGPSAAEMRVGFAAPSFAPGEIVRYAYRLVGRADWSPPFTERSVHLGGLADGAYRFEVRATTSEGVATLRPAVVTFVVLPPFWRRGWFLSIAAAFIGASLVAIHKIRVARLVALEQQRARIARDLHDELGSGLGSIGVLAHLAADGSVDAERSRELSRQIGDTAVEVAEALTDIVRSLRPGETTLASLGNDLRDRARRLFPGTGADLTIRFPERWPSVPLSLPVRRNVLLIGFEAMHNAARHAHARSVILELAPEGRRWRLRVRDDGVGMEAASPGPSGGFGLVSMRQRADEIDAALDLAGRPGGGTQVSLLFHPRARGGIDYLRRRGGGRPG